MVDISMCLNKSCPMKGRCVRYRAVPNKHRQSYSGFIFDGGCPDFIDVKDSPYKLREVRNG
jgi:hypothetical protein